ARHHPFHRRGRPHLPRQTVRRRLCRLRGWVHSARIDAKLLSRSRPRRKQTRYAHSVAIHRRSRETYVSIETRAHNDGSNECRIFECLSIAAGNVVNILMLIFTLYRRQFMARSSLMLVAAVAAIFFTQSALGQFPSIPKIKIPKAPKQ